MHYPKVGPRKKRRFYNMVHLIVSMLGSEVPCCQNIETDIPRDIDVTEVYSDQKINIHRHLIVVNAKKPKQQDWSVVIRYLGATVFSAHSGENTPIGYSAKKDWQTELEKLYQKAKKKSLKKKI